MTMVYELWDVTSGNLINTYDTEHGALAVVRDLLAANGAEYARSLSLAFEDDDEHTMLVAKGVDLAGRAERALNAPAADLSPGASQERRPFTRRTVAG